MLSIVIPALNEEKYLQRLLESLKKQTFKEFEVIVADADSKDKTKEVAEEYEARVVRGGLPSKGKNVGAKAARGDLILFLDSDLFLPENFLEKALEDFRKRKLDIASFFLVPLSRFYPLRVLFNIFFNYPLIVFGKFWPRGAMAVLVRKDFHISLSGFDEEIKFGEDNDYFRRAGRSGKFGFIRRAKVFVSVRRYQREGWLKTCLKYAFMELYMTFCGPIKKDFFEYKFDYPKDKII
jgi:glycosyltransferase involved in cell wall biosynthesis